MPAVTPGFENAHSDGYRNRRATPRLPWLRSKWVIIPCCIGGGLLAVLGWLSALGVS